jgi:hypothetical protein
LVALKSRKDETFAQVNRNHPLRKTPAHSQPKDYQPKSPLAEKSPFFHTTLPNTLSGRLTESQASINEGNHVLPSLLSFFEPQMLKLTSPLMAKMTQLEEKIYARKEFLTALETHPSDGTMPTHIPKPKLHMAPDHDKSFAKEYETDVQTFQ